MVCLGAMPDPIFASFLSVLEGFRPGLTRPSFTNMLVVACGWIVTQGQHAVTQALVVTGVAGRRHHEAFHRFFSRGTWTRMRWAGGCFTDLSRSWVKAP